ncbi:pectin acetylesterase-family hydrolase [Microbacterium sp. B35-04]|jgi:hypothetical protein|uniref:pectin acetylesterase-family hydrolase n=1 Tax=Microbacterium sp. B35-04 TaxID=1961716 RepID=UPI0013D0BBAC|nr:pectin acetylesterase-family hydrolase [Microbacterium sp. B35-04]
MSSSTAQPLMRDAPLKTRLLAPLLRRLRFPALPDHPKLGKWYRITPPGAVSANGEPYHGSIRLGSENKLIVMFHGGGVSWNEYMAARPASMYSKPSGSTFYASDSDLVADLVTAHGVGSSKDGNPFRNWSMISISYGSGDFHVGTADYPYTGLDGQQRTLHHHGYTNYRAVMQEAMKLVGRSPEQIVVTGFSAGGFGTALLTDDIMHLFPDCGDVTCCVDGAFMLYDGWRDAAERVWQAPPEVVERIHSDNLVLDALQALRRDHGTRVRTLFVSSTRDVALAEYWTYVATGDLAADSEAGIAYQRDLKVMCDALREDDPDVGLFIYDTPVPALMKAQRAAGLTTHCIINSRQAERVRVDGVTPLEWLWLGVQGRPSQVGLALLG